MVCSSPCQTHLAKKIGLFRYICNPIDKFFVRFQILHWKLNWICHSRNSYLLEIAMYWDCCAVHGRRNIWSARWFFRLYKVAWLLVQVHCLLHYHVTTFFYYYHIKKPDISTLPFLQPCRESHLHADFSVMRCPNKNWLSGHESPTQLNSLTYW